MGGTASSPRNDFDRPDRAHAVPSVDSTTHDPPVLGPHDRQNSSLAHLATTEFKWNFGGHSVYITGAWDGWNHKVALSRTTPTDFTAVLSLPLGTYQYKFIVDGNWKHNPALPTQRDSHGNLNNIVSVAPRPPEYDSNDAPHEEGPSSPLSSYDFSLLPTEDHTAEPPVLPLMLSHAPLDRFARPEATTTDFVRLNHIFEAPTGPVYAPGHVRMLGTEVRHNAKVITTILILPCTDSGLPPAPNRPPPPNPPHPFPAAYTRRSSRHSSATHPESQSLILDALNNV